MVRETDKPILARYVAGCRICLRLGDAKARSTASALFGGLCNNCAQAARNASFEKVLEANPMHAFREMPDGYVRSVGGWYLERDNQCAENLGTGYTKVSISLLSQVPLQVSFKANYQRKHVSAKMVGVFAGCQVSLRYFHAGCGRCIRFPLRRGAARGLDTRQHISCCGAYLRTGELSLAVRTCENCSWLLLPSGENFLGSDEFARMFSVQQDDERIPAKWRLEH